jgi:hypothetical protein
MKDSEISRRVAIVEQEAADQKPGQFKEQIDSAPRRSPEANELVNDGVGMDYVLNRELQSSASRIAMPR